MHASPPPSSESRARAPRVLVVDDEPEIGAILTRYLEGQGLQVSVVADGAGFRAAMRSPEFDVVLLDLGLPDDEGLALMRELRAHWQGPVIIVSGRGDSVERVVGLELGADDYVTKPFDLRELLARIRSVLRRSQPSPPPSGHGLALCFEGMRLELDARRLLGRGGKPIGLTSGEFELLRTLLERPNVVLTRDQLMNAMHGRAAGPFDRAIDMQVGRLRRKIETDPADPQLIKAVRGAGYMFAASVMRDQG